MKFGKNKDIPFFSDISEANKYMIDNHTYGWHNFKTSENIEIPVKEDENFISNWKLHSTLESFKYKHYICYDVALAAQDILRTQFSKETKYIFIQWPKGGTHAFTIYKDDQQKWWYFEVTWDAFAGLHGPFNTPEEVITKVANQQDPTGYTYKIFDTFIYQKNMDLRSYLDLCGYDYTWGICVVENLGFRRLLIH